MQTGVVIGASLEAVFMGVVNIGGASAAEPGIATAVGVAFFGILFGSDAVSALMEAIPDVVMNGLTVCGGLLPAVGMAMLMKMLWDKKICMFYFLGFILSAYMNLPLIAIAVLGTIVAVAIGMNDYRINQLQAGGLQTVPPMS